MGHKFTVIPTLLLLVVSVYGYPHTPSQDNFQIQNFTSLKAANWHERIGINPHEFGGDDVLFRNYKRSYEYPVSTWPRGVVPYNIDPQFNAQQRALIYEAINEFHKYTCIRFTPYAGEADYVHITGNDRGCMSERVGRKGGRQFINLEIPACVTRKGTAMHELMHAVGFDHEQNRLDRDSYVRILWQNIAPGSSYNFYHYWTMHTFNLTYDYDSIMHYSYTAFSVNGQPTIVPLDQNISPLRLGQTWGFSQTDVAKINRMYNCQMG